MAYDLRYYNIINVIYGEDGKLMEFMSWARAGVNQPIHTVAAEWLWTKGNHNIIMDYCQDTGIDYHSYLDIYGYKQV